MPATALLAVAVACALVVAGCGGSGDEPAGETQAPAASGLATDAPASPTEVTTATQGERTVTVFFASQEADRLLEESRTVPADGSELRAALVELAKGPATSGGLPALPAGTTVIGSEVEGGKALVNLSREFIDGYPSGGAAAEYAVLAPLVYTATAIPGVERVVVTVDGKGQSPVGSQYDWSGGFARGDFPDPAGGTP